MPLREVKSPISSTGSRPECPWGVKHAAVYRERTDTASRPPAPRGAPGSLIDGQITITPEKSK
jgi:hypothetical protein